MAVLTTLINVVGWNGLSKNATFPSASICLVGGGISFQSAAAFCQKYERKIRPGRLRANPIGKILDIRTLNCVVGQYRNTRTQSHFFY